MLHRTIARLLLACVPLIVTGQLSASPPLFGPKSYFRANKPQTFEEEFAASSGNACVGEPMFVLVVENQGISSAVVTLNSLTLLNERDFPGAAFRELAISLAATNHLSVVVKGGARDAALRLTIERRVQETVGGPASMTVVSGPATAHTAFTADAGATHSLLVRNAGAANASVALNGATIIAPSEFSAATRSILRKLAVAAGANEFAITASGAQGAAVEWTLFREVSDTDCAPTIAIASPADGATVSSRKILVTGTAMGSRDIGIAVNGVAAQFGLDAAGNDENPYRWFATLNAPEGDLTITATASTPGGASTTDARTIRFAPAAETVTLEAVPDSGATPLTTYFDLSTNLPEEPVSHFELDLDGDGTYEISSATRPENLAYIYTTDGVYEAHVRVRTASGAVHTSSVLVASQPFPTIDQVIRAAWARFTGSMSTGNAAAAVAQLAGEGARAKYAPALEALGAARLPAFAASIQTIHPVWIHGNAAHYLLVRTEQGEPYGYHVYFVRGSDGVWRIIQF